MKRKVLAVFLVTMVAAVLFAAAAYADEGIGVAIDGELVEFGEQGPVNVDGRVLVPARDVFEQLGFEVDWDEEARHVYLMRGDDLVVIKIDSDLFLVNGEELRLDVSARIIGYSTMVPLRAILEGVGYYVGWDAGANTVLVSSTPIVSAFDMLIAAGEAMDEAILEAGSARFTMIQHTLSVVEGLFGGEEEVIIVSVVDQVVRSATDMDLRIEQEISENGRISSSVSYFRGGVLYTEFDGEWSGQEMSLEDVLESVTGMADIAGMLREHVVSQEITETEEGFRLDFVLVGSFFADMISGQFESLGIMGEDIDIELIFDDVEMVVLIGFDGLTRSSDIRMAWVTVMSIFGMEIPANQLVGIRFEIEQIGGIAVEFPGVLDEL